MTAKEALATIRKNYPYQEFDLFRTLEKALAELETIKSADGGRVMRSYYMLEQQTNGKHLIVETLNGEDDKTQRHLDILKNYILKAQAQEKELRELKTNQTKIKTIEGYGIDDVLAIIQGLKTKEITPEILHNNLLMYKKGYEDALEQVNKDWKDFNSRLMKMDKGSEE